MKKLILAVVLTLLIFSYAKTYINAPFRLPDLSLSLPKLSDQPASTQRVVYEESVVTEVVAKSLPSVVTVGIVQSKNDLNMLELDPFNPFFMYRRSPGQQKKEDRNIGSGFIIAKDGLIITNKHVVSDTEASYKVLTDNNKKFDVEKIYRDPNNDLAILKINATGLNPLPLGDSESLKLGQMAIAIGTPLGEFKNTVTVGIVSGLGRGITAGSPFEGFVEKLDGVIQTDAAINPGNSGGPLLNSKGEVIGVNSAIAQEGQNIGFAIPVNTVKTLITQFESNGSTFERPYLGVQYQMIDRKTAIINELPEGAYVQNVIEGSPADRAGLHIDDIITAVDGKRLNTAKNEDLSQLLSKKKIGESVTLTVWRDGATETIKATIGSQNQ